jgi:hypothetical protein
MLTRAGAEGRYMMSLRKKMVLAVLGVGAILLATGTGGYASPDSLPGGTLVTAAGTLNFSESIDGISVTVTCTNFTATGRVAGATTLYFKPSPTINGCTDSAGGTDTITTNSTNGRWFFTSGTSMKLGIPKAGATFFSSLLPSCVVTWAPTASVQLAGHYNSVNTEKVNDQPLATAATGCTTAAMKIFVKAVMSPAPNVVPPWN